MREAIQLFCEPEILRIGFERKRLVRRQIDGSSRFNGASMTGGLLHQLLLRRCPAHFGLDINGDINGQIMSLDCVIHEIVAIGLASPYCHLLSARSG